ncbi:MAG: M42 family metallopeptidase [Planctomycetia bacterium]|nr:M42 family metallopeptidase [Planctomycetia bacterium]
MDEKSREFLNKLLLTPSPSGYEQRGQEVVREYAKTFADDVRTDVLGNVIAVRNENAPIRVMLAGHCDQIGLGVRHIDADGFISVVNLGGWDIQVLIGQHVTIWTKNGPVDGVLGKKPIHLLKDEERKQVPKITDLWVDIGAQNKEEAEKLVRIGDPITVKMTVVEMQNKRIAASATDDKSGVWVIMEALRRINADKLKCAVFAVSTVQEELGTRGAITSSYGVHPHVGIAVDVTFATDCPTIDPKQLGEVKLGKGAVVDRGPNMNPMVVERLCEMAETHEIPYQLVASGSPPGTDARVIQMSREGVATGLVSVPNRYMHSPVEVVSLDDMDACADLLARFIENLDENTDFIPNAETL